MRPAFSDLTNFSVPAYSLRPFNVRLYTRPGIYLSALLALSSSFRIWPIFWSSLTLRPSGDFASVFAFEPNWFTYFRTLSPLRDRIGSFSFALLVSFVGSADSFVFRRFFWLSWFFSSALSILSSSADFSDFQPFWLFRQPSFRRLAFFPAFTRIINGRRKLF